MSDDRDRLEEEAEGRPRPKVVDKRISARSESEAAGKAAPPPAQQTEPSPEPTPPSEPDPPAEGLPGESLRGADVWTPEQEAQARQLAQEIAQTPSIDWVVNTAATLANVAGTKLDLGAAGDAQLAIDALAGIINAVGPRLGSTEAPLRQVLAQLQMAYASTAGGVPPITQP
ncbi:MAG TPA: hypothetical protein VNC78_03805 [Actinomycetota bacterium]|nr:hypothetical protein [Actinomycetota bacterium]